MKKIFCLLLGLTIAGNASAQTVIIVNNNDSQPVYAVPSNVTVVNRMPAPESGFYYYKGTALSSSGAVITVGTAAFVVGALLSDSLLGHHDRRHAAPIPPKRHPFSPGGHGKRAAKGHGEPRFRI